MHNTILEVPAFLASVYGGMLMGAVYFALDCFKRLLRSHFVKSILDGVFWLVCGCLLALSLVAINGGLMRIYLIIGTASGAMLFVRCAARPAERVVLRIAGSISMKFARKKAK